MKIEFDVLNPLDRAAVRLVLDQWTEHAPVRTESAERSSDDTDAEPVKRGRGRPPKARAVPEPVAPPAPEPEPVAVAPTPAPEPVPAALALPSTPEPVATAAQTPVEAAKLYAGKFGVAKLALLLKVRYPGNARVGELNAADAAQFVQDVATAIEFNTPYDEGDAR